MREWYYLQHIFADIFDGLDGAAILHVDVTLKCSWQKWAVWHNPGVVNLDDLLSSLDLKSVSTILGTSSLVWGVAIRVHDGEWCKGLWKLLLALRPFFAGLSMWVDHLFFDNRQKNRVWLWWNFSTDELVHVSQVNLGLQPEQKVSMRKSSLKCRFKGVL